MVNLYRTTLENRIRPVWTRQQRETHMGETERNIEVGSIIGHLGRALDNMKAYKAADEIDEGHDSWVIPILDPVLVHMDLQPQNIFLARIRRHNETSTVPDTVLSTQDMVVRSVLDWEDSSIADPRFDLLMMCRKICANRDQADTLWKAYQQAYGKDNTILSSGGVPDSDGTSVIDLGPIEPWLQLETVHSLITLLLQSMDLLGGGRNPWEAKKDLWGKLEREFHRLKLHSALPGR